MTGVKRSEFSLHDSKLGTLKYNVKQFLALNHYNQSKFLKMLYKNLQIIIVWYNKCHLCFLSSDNAAQYSLSIFIYYYVFFLCWISYVVRLHINVPFMSQNWKDYLSSEVDRALSQGVIPIELAQEKVMLALTLTLVKGVCELVPSLTRSLFDTMLQYISHRRPR